MPRSWFEAEKEKKPKTPRMPLSTLVQKGLSPMSGCFEDANANNDDESREEREDASCPGVLLE
jgi:hypothetical protein